MADFLSNLVARATRQGSLLERRRPSLFEPTFVFQGQLRDGRQLEEISEERESQAPRRDKAMRRRVPLGEPASREEIAIQQLQPVPRSVTPETESPGSLRLRQVAAEPAAPVVRELIRTTETRVVPERTVLKEKVETVRETLREERERIISKERTEIRPIPARTAERPVPHLDKSARVSSPPSRVVERIITEAKAKPSPRPVPLQRGHRQERSEARTAPPSEEPQVPSVSISIGRVEIRAGQSAPQAQRSSRPSAPKVSLDDYLRQRNGGSL